MAYFHKDLKKNFSQIKEILADKKDLKYLHKKKRSSLCGFDLKQNSRKGLR